MPPQVTLSESTEQAIDQLISESKPVFDTIADQLKTLVIKRALNKVDGNINKAARLLGCSRMTIRKYTGNRVRVPGVR